MPGEIENEKKFYYISSFFICAGTFLAEENEKIIFYKYGIDDVKYTIYPDKIIIGKQEIDRNHFFLDEEGFYHLIYSDNNERIFIFRNNGELFSFDLNPNENKHTVETNNWLKQYKKQIDESNKYLPFLQYKAEYTASSELTEKSTRYIAKNLATCFIPNFDKSATSDYWNPLHKPWVEGVQGYGENESIQLKTEIPFSRLEVINGYVDLTRRDLYKKNSRVKTFLVKDIDNNTEFYVTMKDEVIIQDISFPAPTSNVILYIKEVYKGDKWDDTCITSIVC